MNETKPSPCPRCGSTSTRVLYHSGTAVGSGPVRQTPVLNRRRVECAECSHGWREHLDGTIIGQDDVDDI